MFKVKSIISKFLIYIIYKINPEYIHLKVFKYDNNDIYTILKADREYILTCLAKRGKQPDAFSEGVYFSDAFDELAPLTNEYLNTLIFLTDMNSIIKKYNS